MIISFRSKQQCSITARHLSMKSSLLVRMLLCPFTMAVLLTAWFPSLQTFLWKCVNECHLCSGSHTLPNFSCSEIPLYGCVFASTTVAWSWLWNEPWGLEMDLLQDCLYPNQTDLLPASETLLHSVWCNCKTDCHSRQCSCKKHGLSCSVACGNCRGVSCANSVVPSLSDLTDDFSDATDFDWFDKSFFEMFINNNCLLLSCMDIMSH